MNALDVAFYLLGCSGVTLGLICAIGWWIDGAHNRNWKDRD